MLAVVVALVRSMGRAVMAVLLQRARHTQPVVAVVVLVGMAETLEPPTPVAIQAVVVVVVVPESETAEELAAQIAVQLRPILLAAGVVLAEVELVQMLVQQMLVVLAEVESRLREVLVGNLHQLG